MIFIVSGIDRADGREYPPKIVEADSYEEAALKDVEYLGDDTYRVAVYVPADRREFAIAKYSTIRRAS